MMCGISVSVAVAALSSLAQAQIHMPLKHNAPPSTLVRRGDSALAALGGVPEYATYKLNVSIGTPPQDIEVGLSLATWDSWVPVERSGLDYIYDPDASSTYQEAGNTKSYFSASYVDGSSASGEWGRDTVAIGDASVSDILFGLASRVTDTDMGILALGYPVLNSIVSSEDFLGSLAAAGEISTAAFSIWADDPEGLEGNILFGAIDPAQYEGELQRVNMPDYYAIYVNTMNATNSDGANQRLITSDDALKMSVSPTDTVSTFPAQVAFEIWELANATYEPETGYARIQCDAGKDSNLVFSLMLGGKYGPTIDVSLDDLILSRTVYPASKQWRDNGGNWCLFGVQNSTRSGLYSLGKPMWTRTYLVFDAFNREMAVAPVVYGSSLSSTPTPFEKYGARIPESKAACTASEWACTGSGTSDDSSGRYYSSPRRTPLYIIVIIVAVVGGISLIVGIGGSIWCCKRQGLCCFARSHKRDAAIARHAAAAAEASNPAYAYPSDVALATGPPMMEKYAGAPSAYAPVYPAAGASLGPLQVPDRSVSPLSDVSVEPQPAGASGASVGVSGESSVGAPLEPQPSPKGKGRAE